MRTEPITTLEKDLALQTQQRPPAKSRVDQTEKKQPGSDKPGRSRLAR